MRVLVTGSAGFIGSHVCDLLLGAGCTVYGEDNRSSGVDFTPHKVLNASGHRRARIEGLDAIVHCAARADIRHNWTSDGHRQQMWEDNVDLTRSLLEAYRGVPVVFLSTGAVYGRYGAVENHSPTDPASPYAASKVAAEALIQAYEPQHHILRLSRVVGARYHHGHIADFVRMAKEGKWAPLGSGLERAACVHVKDVALAVLHCLCLGRLAPWGAYNVTSGQEMSPRDTAALMGLGASREWPSNTLSWKGDVSPFMRSAKLHDTGWSPTLTARQGVLEALESLGWKR